MTHIVSMRDRPDLRRHWERRGDGAGVVRIDRRTRWGNPFKITDGVSRAQAIALYREDLWRRIRAGEIALEDLAALDSRTLLCHCRPRLACHGDVLARAAQWATIQLGRTSS